MTMRLGYDEAGQGPALVLIHGFPMDRRLWQFQVAALSDEFRVISLDLRGRGKSAAPASAWSIDDHADDVISTLDALGLDRVHLGGLSMGGYVAFALWARQAARLRSLVLVNTKPNADSAEAKEARVATAELVERAGTLALANTHVPKLVAERSRARVGPIVEAMMRDVPGATSARDALAMRDRPDRSAELPAIAVPTLVVHGTEDALMPCDQAANWAQAIPHSEFCPIAGAGHVTPLEQPEQMNARLRMFLRGLPPEGCRRRA